MRVRERKFSGRMSQSDQAPCSTKKRRKEEGRTFWQRKKDVATSLITSSTRKQRIDTTSSSLCLVSPTIVRVLPGAAEASAVGEDLCRNLHLTFSSMDSALADGKEIDAVSNPQPGPKTSCEGEGAEDESRESALDLLDPTVTAIRPSILETIFSPVFHLFSRGYGEELPASCQSSVEQMELPGQRLGQGQATNSLESSTSAGRTLSAEAASYASVEDTPSVQVTSSNWDNGAHQEPCSMQMTSSAEDIAACRFDPCVGLSPAEDQSLSMKPSIENCVVTLVDASGECIDWDPLDDKAGSEGERPALDHAASEADVMASDDADLFLAVEQSKSLECNDEGSHERDVVVEEEEEFEDIDPYLFIKRLPCLSEVVSPCRPLLLPRQTRRSPPITLVLDLDETLVHSTLELCDDADFSFPVHFDCQEHMVFVRRRPHLQMFMERVAQLFEIIVFTASQSVYAEQLLNVLDPKRKLIRHRIFRDSCVFVRGNYLKDLTILGRDLSKVAIIDNSPQAYGFQVDNGIPIESWFDDRSDTALAGLIPFLETLVGVDDVRPIIAKRFNLRGKIAAAAELPYITSRGDPLDRFS